MKKHPDNSAVRSNGFTLIELSLVLVIIGLIVGGVLVGQNMIEAARLRSVLSDLNRFNQAVMGFKLKYNALPGDMTNATQFWGLDPVNDCADSVGWAPAAATETCNGNGNGRIGNADGNRSYWDGYECQRFWQQLANAQMIEGQYSGVFGAWDHNYLTLRLTNPPSRIRNAGYTLCYDRLDTTQASQWANEAGHYYNLRGMSYQVQTQTDSQVPLTPWEAYWLDEKTDDGRPALGKVKVGTPAYLQPYCSIGNDASTAVYNLTYGEPNCAPIFRAEGF